MGEFDTPLILTTPHMTGQKVKDAQWLMAGNNRFKGLAPFKDGKIDGEYGQLSAAATKSTKFWLGYPLKACDDVFGQTLYEYLLQEHWRPLPKTYRDRRDARIAAAVKTPGQKALEFAIKEIGNHEDPYGSNLNKYGAWYGYNGVAWCAIFESYCYGHTGRESFRYASCLWMYLDAARGNNGLKLVYSPAPGDSIIYSIHGDAFAHTAFFEKWVDENAGSFYDIGGNTGPTNISNGGAVMRQLRNKTMISHIVRTI